MALSHEVSYTTTGTKPSINMDPSIAPFNASLAVTLGSTGTYSVQYSLSDFSTVTDANALWFTDSNLGVGTAASGVTNYMFPVTRVRVVIAALGTTLTLQTLQGFTTN